jgi:diguanylate cyclase (GGDEF)-like protein/PAS domain S-box-containing protein
MDAKQVLEEINTCLKEAMLRGLGRNGFTFPFDPNVVADDDLRDICDRLSAVFDMINESYRYSEQLAQGNLKAKTSRTNIFAMPLKGLQASLAHLTWQADQVAKGDLNQQVQFLGDFSASFNHMISSIREKRILEQQFKLITDVVGEGIFLVDSEGQIIFSNPEANRLLGYNFDKIKGLFIQDVINKQQLDGTLYKPDDNPLYNAITTGDTYNKEGAFTCKSGFLMPVVIACRPVFKDDILNGAVIAFRDITEQKKYLQSLETINKLLETQATTDALTGIYNRIKFNHSLTIEISRAERNNSPLSLIIFDIDYFKKVNDTYGHSAGDNVLKRLAKLVETNTRETDILARWGGEEFVILAQGISLGQTVKLADKLRQKIEEFDFKKPHKITASFGVADFKKGDSSMILIDNADEALFRAKRSGRNQVKHCIKNAKMVDSESHNKPVI